MPNKMNPSKNIYVSASPIKGGGRGVFATKHIVKDEIIETCPVVVLPEELAFQKQSKLYNYFFIWKTKEDVAVALGFGSLYNHSYQPNATYKKNLESNTIDFVALEDIEKDDEITVNYNYGKPDDKSTLWIKSIKPSVGQL